MRGGVGLQDRLVVEEHLLQTAQALAQHGVQDGGQGGLSGKRGRTFVGGAPQVNDTRLGQPWDDNGASR
jgi:hypothetical protein